VPATEISAVDGEYEELHVLGYGIDHRSALLGERLKDARADRERRAEAMTDKLRELGYAIDPAPIEARKAAGKPVGRPHLAAAVLAHPGNAERLAAEGHEDVSSFIPAYLIQGKPGYIARAHPTVEEAIAWIHDAAGVAVWAHPFWDIKDDGQVLAAIDRYRAAGLDGVEVFYASHTKEQTLLLADRCAELGLLATGSSDYHGPEHRLFSRFQAFDLHGREPNLGPIPHGTLAAPTRSLDSTGLCFWLTGLSGSGKSTVARLAAGRLRDRGHRVEVLDGDDVRQNLCAGLGFSPEDRRENVRRIAWVADILSRNDVITFAAAVSPYRSMREEARARMGTRFVEVYVRASVDECERRDVKGLYQRARAGEIKGFTGVSDPYEEPTAPELTLDTETEAVEQSAERLIGYVEERLAGARPAAATSA
jgi:3',5'-nucleoside bisphosphate phosphatase